MHTRHTFALWLLLAAGSLGAAAEQYDVLVYGATAGGVAAAVQVARMGRPVVLAEPGRHIGGLTSGGLGMTDTGSRAAIGGLAREFYTRVADHYRTKYGPQSPQFADCHGGFRFEPHVAEDILVAMLAEARVPVLREHRLVAVTRRNSRLTAALFANRRRVGAAQFIDATYEGDLMALAKVAYTVGRESNAVYGETINGRQFMQHHNFRVPMDPYVVPGNPASGLLWGISAEAPGQPGEGDKAVQAYNFRMCLTTAANRLPFPRPEGYDARCYELLLRYIQAGVWDVLRLTARMPNHKTDTNNYGGFSTDFIGGNHDYPEADWAGRQRIIAAHRTYQQGLMYFLSTDPRVPEKIRKEVNAYGLPTDEFTDSGGWPTQLYVREARRMVAAVVMTEHHCRGKEVARDGVGLASYGMDSHNCRRVVVDGRVRNEGDVEVGVAGPYPVAFAAVVPREQECPNLAVPVCLSASHIAYGSIRMEPVFMVLGQSVATAACLALDRGTTIQAVDYAALRARLLADKQVLDPPAPEAPENIDPKTLPGVTLDDRQAQRTGVWLDSAIPGARQVGTGYVHDGNANKGQTTLTWTARVPRAGRWEVWLLAPYSPNRSTKVPVVLAAGGRVVATWSANQRVAEAQGRLRLGVVELPANTDLTVTVSNRDTDGYVVADGLQFIEVKPAAPQP